MCYGILNNSEMSDVCWGNQDIFVETTNIPLLLYYFRSCLQATELLKPSDKQKLLETLSDRVNSILPEIKLVYNDGNTDDDMVQNFYDLINEIKFTELSYVDLQPESNYYNHQPYSWSNRRVFRMVEHSNSPEKVYFNFKKVPLKITATLEEQKQACDNLILLTKKSGASKGATILSNYTNWNRNKQFNDNFHRIVPVPVLHIVRKKLQSIAIPLKTHSIYSVTENDSKNVLVHYYVTAMKCLTLFRRFAKQDVYEFNKSFCLWIEKEVIPHILGHEYYPAFSGVFQILETMQTKGFAEDCVERINDKEASLLKKNREKESDFSLPYDLDESDSVMDLSIGKNRTELDFEDLLQTMIPVLGMQFTSSSGGIESIECESTEYDAITKFQPFLHTETTSVSSQDKSTVQSQPAILKFFTNTPPEYLLGIFFFLIAALLATWAAMGSLCVVFFRPNKKYDDRTNYKYGTCPYDPGERVIIMMKDEYGNPQYYYGTFHLDKNQSKIDDSNDIERNVKETKYLDQNDSNGKAINVHLKQAEGKDSDPNNKNDRFTKSDPMNKNDSSTVVQVAKSVLEINPFKSSCQHTSIMNLVPRFDPNEELYKDQNPGLDDRICANIPPSSEESIKCNPRSFPKETDSSEPHFMSSQFSPRKCPCACSQMNSVHYEKCTISNAGYFKGPYNPVLNEKFAPIKSVVDIIREAKPIPSTSSIILKEFTHPETSGDSEISSTEYAENSISRTSPSSSSSTQNLMTVDFKTPKKKGRKG